LFRCVENRRPIRDRPWPVKVDIGMETFGILFSFPGALILITIYRRVLLWASPRFSWIDPLFRLASVAVMSMFAAEMILLATFGTLRSRAMVGPSFYLFHSLVFFLSPPALANLLVLRKPISWTARGYAVVQLCAALAFFLVVLQYDVYETLYGIDGIGGPYS
jgi:hypothetical protein